VYHNLNSNTRTFWRKEYEIGKKLLEVLDRNEEKEKA